MSATNKRMAGNRSSGLPRDLGDGLLLRHATRQDADALEEFNARIHGNPTSGEPDRPVGIWAHDLAAKPHPTFDVSDYTIVEHLPSKRIVSSVNLISQRWSYEGIPFGVGRPELVGTEPEFRRKGLVRIQMDLIHEWSRARGEMLQAITGIPYYYRQFGYEMAVTLGGARDGFAPMVPSLKEGESEPYTVRPAREEDLPFIARLYEEGSKRYPLACLRDEEMWRYELSGRSEQGINTQLLRIIENGEGAPVGYLAHPGFLWGTSMPATQYEVAPGVSWLDVTPSVVRYLWRVGAKYAERDGKTLEKFSFGLGAWHPVYDVMGKNLPQVWEPYAWFVRIPDLSLFLGRIAPALSRLLEGSPAKGYHGELTLSFYRSGLRLRFEKGILEEVEPWQPPHPEAGNAMFPGLTFLQLLLGYRSLADLRYAFPDCRIENETTRFLLDTLFPMKPSHIWAIS